MLYVWKNNTTVITHNQVACRQEQYFRNANSFVPERWLFRKASIDGSTKNESSDKWNKPSPFLVLPFGFGPRKCIGRQFAEMEIYVCLAKLLRNFQVEYHGEDIETVTRLINVADKPMRFTFIDTDE
ncbi:cytochrome P450 302a1-like protein [Leptotrombidium deliense]|uniref:Cytochrome P450 302a1-like protein n=1 Tax=Leptotrombidium deliense TaxID=299467 RepID=A0A443SV94_9ACAR|nr:cytochrome P450 302a1-like protein [Leptotrombidium deliense]